MKFVNRVLQDAKKMSLVIKALWLGTSTEEQDRDRLLAFIDTILGKHNKGLHATFYAGDHCFNLPGYLQYFSNKNWQKTKIGALINLINKYT